MIINKKLDSSLIVEIQKFQKRFLEKIDINIFKEEEKEWIRKNLDFIYLSKGKDVTLAINPFCKFTEKDFITENNISIKNPIFYYPNT